MTKAKLEVCPYPGREAARVEERTRMTVWESTRADPSQVDAHRDFDGFDVDLELARLRSALATLRIKLHASKTLDASVPNELLLFIATAAENIDEWLLRGGSLPKAWGGPP
jgi:hypothetical protein